MPCRCHKFAACRVPYDMNDKIKPFLENASESTAACLVTMAQGNILAIGLGHWLVASQTGLLAGLVTTGAVIATQTDKRWVVSVFLGVTTAVVDFFMHPGSFGPVFMEAVVTGIGAAALSFIAGTLYRLYRDRQMVAA